MGKTSDLFKKIRDIKGAFHAKVGTIKGRNIMDLTEAEDIKKRWQEYTEELYKKGLNDLDNHDGVITHLEPDILECQVKCYLYNVFLNKFQIWSCLSSAYNLWSHTFRPWNKSRPVPPENLHTCYFSTRIFFYFLLSGMYCFLTQTCGFFSTLSLQCQMSVYQFN